MAEIEKVNIMPRPEAWDHVRTPLTDNVNEQHPLVVELMTSYRSGYCYLAMDLYANLHRDYNVDVQVRFIRPILMRDPSYFLKQADYRYLYDPMDMGRQAQFLELPWRGYMVPDICKTAGNIVTPAPDEEQDLFYQTYAISALVQSEHPDKVLSFAQQMFRNLYGGVDDWHLQIPSILTGLGLDAEDIDRRARADRQKYIDIVAENERYGHSCGHGGVPCGIFRGEPFWGHDRFDTLVWRLKQNGLTRRWPPAVD